MVRFEDNGWMTNSEASGFLSHTELLQLQIEDYEEKMQHRLAIFGQEAHSYWMERRDQVKQELLDAVVEFVHGLVHRLQ
jgi:hypothetical protein